MLHQNAVPGSLTGHDVHDHFHAELVRFIDQTLEVVGGAVVGIDGVKVAHSERTANGAFLHLFADGMNRHQPENVHAKILQIIQPRGNRIEVAFLGKVAREDFIDNRAAEPVG